MGTTPAGTGCTGTSFVVLVGQVPELGPDLQGLDLDSDPDSDLQDSAHLD